MDGRGEEGDACGGRIIRTVSLARERKNVEQEEWRKTVAKITP